MKNRDRYEEQKFSTSRGQDRRDFLRSSMFAAAGASMTAALPGMSAAASRTEMTAQSLACSDVKMPMQDVAGKVAFITGGASGIGLGAAQAFVSAGMKVVLADINEQYLKEALESFAAANQSGQVHGVRVDVTDRAAMEQAAAETVKVFGKVHVLFNNAGVYFSNTLSATPEKEWRWLMNVNVNGVLNGVQVFLPLIRSHGEGGQILATSSVLGLFVWWSTDAAYVASKFAVNGMMESLRMEVADQNIGVSILCPGWVGTNLGSSSRRARPGASAQADSSENRAKIEREKKAAVDAGLVLDATEVGQRVLQGMRHNDLYILTHPEWEQMMQNRHEVLLASLPRGVRPVEERASKAREMTQASIYTAELSRKGCRK